MALPWLYHGSFTYSAGLYSALAKQAKLLSLKPVSRVEFTFDPFSEKAVTVRNIANYFYSDRVRDTNPKCILKTTVVNTREEPTVLVKLVDNKKILFKTNDLQVLEILQKYNELVSSKAKTEETTEAAKPKQTKSQKKR